MSTTATALIDRVAADIAAGRLAPGTRLPPQRTFAYNNGIATSTASRVYGELLRRGLVVGEVGRGTFVADPHAPAVIKGEPADGRIDLEFNYPTVPEQFRIIQRSLATLQRPEIMSGALDLVTRGRLEAARKRMAAFLALPQWQPDPAGLMFTGSGRQSIAAVLAALVPMGGRFGVEALTYPLVKSIARQLGITPVPIALDAEGVTPAALSKAHRATPFSVIYLQPQLQNPLGHCMGEDRRSAIAALARKIDLVIIEDRVPAFLVDDPPIAAMAPERSIIIDSLSKRVAAGAALGIIHSPAALIDKVATSVRSGAWMASPFALQVGLQLIADGAVAELGTLKRADGPKRQRIVAQGLAPALASGARLRAAPQSYHAWLELPDGWRAETFAAAAARLGIAVTPATAFAVTPGHAPNAVRLALGLPPHDVLTAAMATLARLLTSRPEDADVTE